MKNIMIMIGAALTILLIEILFSSLWGFALAFVIPLTFWKIALCIFAILEISRAVAVVVKGLDGVKG